MTEWDALTYHRVAEPQVEWGRRVLEAIDLEGDERVIDAGCGTGRLTAEVLSRLPHGRALAIDRSENMLAVARRELVDRFSPRIAFLRTDLQLLALRPWADLVFSTATFHWVRDHPALFASLYSSLAPGGRLVAQCGGGANLARLCARAATLMADPPFAEHFGSWTDPWEFATAEVTRARLRTAGFVDIETSLVEAPVVFAGRAQYRDFLACVIVRPHLEYLPASLHAAFLDALVEQASADRPAFALDYWRLNIAARKDMG